jgi:hypothetical protein
MEFNFDDFEKINYDPLKIPPDITLAINHGKAKTVSIPKPNSNKFCPCCNMSLQNKPYSLWVNLNDLAYLG